MVEPNCLFCRIVEGAIPAALVFEDETALAFKDINPQAPLHYLIIPRKHIPSLSAVEPEDEAIVGHLFRLAGEIAGREGVAEEGYRTVVNNGQGAGQTVFHIHVHLLAGRDLSWPPG